MPIPLRLGVLTFHKCFNYGAYWQARCLVEALQSMGHNAVILDHHSWRVDLSEWKCGYFPRSPEFRSLITMPAYGRKIRAFQKAQDRLPLSLAFSLDKPATMEEFDSVIVGSDEVWNLKHPWYGGKELFFGKGIRSRSLVSYAASFGNYPATEELPPRFSENLRQFKAISVRDLNSQKIIRDVVGIEPELVLDPCLQFEPNPDSDSQLPDEPYAVVYGWGFTKPLGQQVKRWAKGAGVRLVSVGYHNDWADENRLSASPDDFVNLMRNARAVATNFFHGCVFSLKYERPFVCESLPYRAIKIHDLLSMVGAERHQVRLENMAESWIERLNEPLNLEIVERINRLRESSQAYLDRVLRSSIESKR